MVLPTRKLLILLLLPAAVMLLWRTTVGIGFGVGLDVGLVALALVDLLISPHPRKLKLIRDIRPAYSLGADNALGWELVNGNDAALAFELRDDLPESFRSDRERVIGKIAARSRAKVVYNVRPSARGRYDVGDIHLRCATTLGLLVRQTRIPARSSVKVYPNLLNLQRYELALQRNRTQSIGIRAARDRGAGMMFESLREHVVGDDWANIAWKATARRGRLITRNHEAERNQNILVVLDCGRLMTPEVDGLSLLDHAINATLLLTYVAMKQGDSIGLLAFSDDITGYVPPTRGKGALARVNEALYQLEPSLAEPNYDRACRYLALRYRKRSLIVVFTDVVGREASASLLAHMARFARQHLPLCVTMRNLEVERLVASVPASPRDCFVKALAIESTERRTEALRQMRQFGVDVLDADPRALSPNVVNRYFSLKRRRM